MRIPRGISICMVATAACLFQACVTLQPRAGGSEAIRPASQCLVTVRNESGWPLEVSFTIVSGAGAPRRSGTLGSVGSGRSASVPAFCGETVIARGSADGRVAQGSAVAREGGPNEIILRLTSP